MEAAVVLAVTAVLVAAWAAASRRHLDRRERQAADWTDESDERPDLWTSSAACVHCSAVGGLLELRGDEVHYTCLACGGTHLRETRA